MNEIEVHERVVAKVAHLRGVLELMGDPQTKTWWEQYMKRVIAFRGIKMAELRRALLEWWAEHVAAEPLAMRRAVASTLFESTWSEDKLAGVLAFELLAPKLRPDDLDAIEALFRRGLLYDWNNTDWLCVKALDKLVRRELSFAVRIAGWTALDDAPVWQRRSGAVAFVRVARAGRRPPASPELWALMFEAATNNLESQERFLQTSAGWLLREMSHAAPDEVAAFAHQHRSRFGREAWRMATARLPEAMGGR